MFSLNACGVNRGGIQVGGRGPTVKHGPPPHAPAHGYRAKYAYRYYPSANAYYDVERKSYFYLEGNNWRVGVSLPDSLSVRLGNYVTIGMDSDKPYTSFEAHKRQYQ